MSVIVKGMEMPKNCKQCLFSRYILGEYFCRTTTTLDEDGEEMWESVGRFGFIRRPDWCPLRPLPEKHGRLIDAEALRERFPEPNHENGGWLNPEEAWIHKTGVWVEIRSAPTIVESEGE